MYQHLLLLLLLCFFFIISVKLSLHIIPECMPVEKKGEEFRLLWGDIFRSEGRQLSVDRELITFQLFREESAFSYTVFLNSNTQVLGHIHKCSQMYFLNSSGVQRRSGAGENPCLSRPPGVQRAALQRGRRQASVPPLRERAAAAQPPQPRAQSLRPVQDREPGHPLSEEEHRHLHPGDLAERVPAEVHLPLQLQGQGRVAGELPVPPLLSEPGALQARRVAPRLPKQGFPVQGSNSLQRAISRPVPSAVPHSVWACVQTFQSIPRPVQSCPVRARVKAVSRSVRA